MGYVYINTVEYYSALKRVKMSFAATWMNLDRDYHIISEVSQRENDKYHLKYYMEYNFLNDTNVLIYKTETGS